MGELDVRVGLRGRQVAPGPSVPNAPANALAGHVEVRAALRPRSTATSAHPVQLTGPSPAAAERAREWDA